MTRALAVTLIALSVLLTVFTIWSNLIVRTTIGPAHFAAEFSRLITCSSWLLLAMLWCTRRVVESNQVGYKEVGQRVDAKVDKLETHLDESIAEVGERLDGVEDVIEDLDNERIQANAIVISIFRNRKSV